MPQVTVYIREEDLETWKGVVKKSEFMHNALQKHSTYGGAPIVPRETLEDEVADEAAPEITQVLPDDRYKWDPTIEEWYDTQYSSYVGPNKPNKAS